MTRDRTTSDTTQARQSIVVGWSNGMTFGFGPKDAGSIPALTAIPQKDIDFDKMCEEIIARFPKTLAYLATQHPRPRPW